MRCVCAQVCWQPFTNNVCTGSGDKTVSLWDARSGLCVQTFYGHLNACSHVVINNRGDTIASSDADGIVKLWDVRMVAEMGTIEVSQHPVNKISFDRSATRVIAASDDGIVRGFDVGVVSGGGPSGAADGGGAPAGGGDGKALIAELRGHEDAVQCAVLDPADNLLVTTSSDCTFRIWS